MDLACFVGLAERGPLGRAVAIDSWDDFLLRFGRRGGFRLLPEAVHQFFVNGGRKCVVIRTVGEASTAQYYLRGLTWSDGSSAFVSARDPGAWGSEVDPAFVPRYRPLTVEYVNGNTVRGSDTRVGVGSVLYFEPEDQYRLVREVSGLDWTVTPVIPGSAPRGSAAEGARMPGVFEVTLDFIARHGDRAERFEGLGLDVRHPRWAMQVVDRDSWLVRPDPALVAPAPGTQPTLRIVPDAPDDSALISGGSDGASTTTRVTFLAGVDAAIPHYGGAPGAFEAMQVWDDGSAEEHSVSRELEPITQVVFPDLVHPGVYDPAELTPVDEPDEAPGLRFEVCRSDEPEPEDADEAISGSPYLPLAIAGDFDPTAHQIAVSCEADGRIALLDVPPSYAANDIMALRKTVVSRRVAFYAPWQRVANTDGTRWRIVGLSGAAAGIIAAKETRNGVGGIPANVDLAGLLDLYEPSTLPADDFLHQLRINRARLDWGTYRLMGSRVAIDDSRAGHLNVQRLMLYLARQLAIDARFAVFEPNNRKLWLRLRQTIERRLSRLHDQGALAGATADEAYRVKVDADTQTLQGLDNGQVRALIGVAPAVPMEFIDVVFRLVADRGLEVVDG